MAKTEALGEQKHAYQERAPGIISGRPLESRSLVLTQEVVQQPQPERYQAPERAPDFLKSRLLSIDVTNLAGPFVVFAGLTLAYYLAPYFIPFMSLVGSLVFGATYLVGAAAFALTGSTIVVGIAAIVALFVAGSVIVRGL